MDGSILNDTKKALGISSTDTSFDQDILIHINSVFSVLQQMGIGPATGYFVESSDDDWSDYVSDDNAYSMLKSYMYLKVRMLFDPPNTSFLLDAFKQQISEFESRLSIQREWDLNPVDPML